MRRAVCAAVVAIGLLLPSLAFAEYLGEYAGSVTVELDGEKVREAVRNAHVAGLLAGYYSKEYDLDKGRVRLYASDNTRGFYRMVYIKMEVDASGEVPVLVIRGYDQSHTNEKRRLRYDMEKIASRVRGCCGL